LQNTNLTPTGNVCAKSLEWAVSCDFKLDSMLVQLSGNIHQIENIQLHQGIEVKRGYKKIIKYSYNFFCHDCQKDQSPSEGRAV